MDKINILAKIKEIKSLSDEGESPKAHMLEDRLMLEFITFIAKHTDDLGEKARLILRTRDIEFSRWYE